MTPLRIQIHIDFSGGLHYPPPQKKKHNWQNVWVDLALKFAVDRKSLNIMIYYQFIVSMD